MIGGEAENALTDLHGAGVAVDCLHHADHFVPGFAVCGGIAIVGQIVQVAYVAAAEGQSFCAHEGGARKELRLRDIHEDGLAASDDLDGFHGDSGLLADGISARV